MLDALIQDIAHARRSLGRAPGLTAVVVITLALGIGATTALFSLFNAIVLRPLPVKDADRLVSIGLGDARGQPPFIYAATFDAFRSQQRAFDVLAMYSGGAVLRAEARSFSVDGGVEGTSAGYLEILGATPLVGRFFSQEEAAAPDGTPVVVLSYRFWQRYFGGDPGAVGERLMIEGSPLTVIGVTPRAFFGLQADLGSDFFVPLSMLRQVSGDPARPLRARNVVARRRADVSFDQARAEVLALWPGIQNATIPAGFTPAEQTDLRSWRAEVISLDTGFSFLRLRYANPITILVGLTALMLAIACVNVSGLLMARAVARDGQFAIRRALGATRWRLVRLPLIESTMLSVAGACMAMPFAWWTSAALGSQLRATAILPSARPMTPDHRVLGVIALLAVASGLLAGLLPAVRAGRAWNAMAPPGHRSLAGSLGRAGRRLLVLQIALSLVLVTGAALFTRSLANLHANEGALSAGRIAWTRLWLQPSARRASFDGSYYLDLAGRFARIPGVEDIAFSQTFPAALPLNFPLQGFVIAGEADATAIDGVSEAVSPGFFRTFHIPRIFGRDFTWEDAGDKPAVAIVNAAFARKLFGVDNAVGRRVRDARDPQRRPLEIVGVVGDAPMGNIRAPHVPALFRPMLQDLQSVRVPIVSVRTTGDPSAIRAAFADAAASLGRHFVRGVLTLDDWLAFALLQERLLAGFASWFAGLAIVLASIGIYGMFTYAVAQRTREIGVRMALGASRGMVLRTIVADGIGLAIGGIVIGVPCALAAGRLIPSMLYGMSPNDPATLIGASAVFVAVAFAAAWLPARRASSIEPIAALRQD